MTEVSITPFVCTIDVVQNCIDYQSLVDYLKSSFKKEIFFINCNDFADVASRQSKHDHKSDKKSKINISNHIAKGVKAKIDSENTKLLDLKKKILAANERMAQKAKTNDKLSKKNGKTTSETKLSVPFDGAIDVMYILTNYPYLPDQLHELINVGLSIDAFISFVPQDPGENVSLDGKPLDKTSTFGSKKFSVPGYYLDFTLNPSCYPPQRWVSLKQGAPSTIPFIEVKAQEGVESLFHELERVVNVVLVSRKEFDEKFANSQFLEIPVASKTRECNVYKSYLRQFPDDIINAIYYELKSKSFKPNVPASDEIDPMDQLFSKYSEKLSRKVVFKEKPENYDPVFSTDVSSTLRSLAYKLSKWTINEQNALACEALTNFISIPENFYCYCGLKFEQIVTMLNKKHSLGLPNQFFDWQQWNYMHEQTSKDGFLLDALSNSSIVDVSLDENIGAVYILTMAPVSKTNGQIITDYYMPPVLDGISDFIEYYKDSTPNGTKKSRNLPTIADVITKGIPIESTLPPIQQRINASVQKIYKLPYKVSNSNDNTAFYNFPSQLKVNVKRDVLFEKIEFSTSAYFKNIFSLYHDNKRIVISLVDGLRIIYEDDFKVSLLYNDQSILYDGNDLTLKNARDPPMIITGGNSFIFNDCKDIPTIINPDGSVCKHQGGYWTKVDSDGKRFDKVADIYEETEYLYAKLTDIPQATDIHIRSDETKYFTKDNGYRKVVLGEDFYVEYLDDKIVFDIPNLPIVEADIDKKVMGIGEFNVSFSGKYCEISCNEYTIELNDRNVSIEHEEASLFYALKRVEIKTSGIVFIADDKGVEIVGNILTEVPKKKIVIHSTKFGNVAAIKSTYNEQQLLDLHKIFVPRFFVLRKDYTCSEFLRKDTLPEGYEEKISTLMHPSGRECTCITRHNMKDDSEAPRIYVEHPSLPKQDRSNILKNLHLPKSVKNNKKKIETKIDVDTIKGVFDAALEKTHTFNKILYECLEKNHNEYLDSKNPHEEEDNFKPPLPPQTPDPYILIMMSNKYTNNRESFWESNHSRFSRPIYTKEHVLRAQSPRVALFDPPRYFIQNDTPPVDYEVIEKKRKRITQTQPSPTKPRPKALAIQPKIINFGNIKAYCSAKASMIVTNTGTAPLHYTVTQPQNPLLKVLTHPGVVFPGLKMTLHVSLSPGEPQDVHDQFVLKTPLYEMPIPISASIVEQ